MASSAACVSVGAVVVLVAMAMARRGAGQEREEDRWHGRRAPTIGRPREFACITFLGERGGTGWGKVVAQAEVDAEGRFHLELPAQGGDRPRGRRDTLWAYRPGSLLAAMPVRRDSLPAGLPSRLNIGPPALSRFEVRGPEGGPVSLATITPRVLKREYLSVPDGLAEKIASETGPTARAGPC